MSDLEHLANNLGNDILEETKELLGRDWHSLSTPQRESIRETGAKYMEIQLRLRVCDDPKEEKELKEKQQALESTVADWKAWGEFAIEEAFWEGVKKVASIFGSFLGAFATEAAGRIIERLT